MRNGSSNRNRRIFRVSANFSAIHVEDAVFYKNGRTWLTRNTLKTGDCHTVINIQLAFFLV